MTTGVNGIANWYKTSATSDIMAWHRLRRVVEDASVESRRRVAFQTPLGRQRLTPNGQYRTAAAQPVIIQHFQP
jgi:hypothetical protein